MSHVVPLCVHKWMQDNPWAYRMSRAMASAAVDARRQHHAETAGPSSTAGSIGKLLRAVEPLPAAVAAVAFNTAALYR